MAGVLLAENLALAAWWTQGRVRAPDVGAAERGLAVAERNGCFGCHGPGGSGGVANPGSGEREVPAWSGGTAMMYVLAEPEIREWILDGAPARLRDAHHEYDKPLFAMPAYRGRIDESELTDLVAYFKAVSRFDNPPSEKALRGRTVASENGCFGCHGPMGTGGIQNPGSFKGVVPGWDGADFRDLVRNRKELEEWTLDGVASRFRDNPAARLFLDRQAIAMPAYRSRLSDEDLDAVVELVEWVHASSEAQRRATILRR